MNGEQRGICHERGEQGSLFVRHGGELLPDLGEVGGDGREDAFFAGRPGCGELEVLIDLRFGDALEAADTAATELLAADQSRNGVERDAEVVGNIVRCVQFLSHSSVCSVDDPPVGGVEALMR